MVSVEHGGGEDVLKIGDLIKFKGTWGSTVPQGERQTGVVMQIWTSGRTRRQLSADVLWDNGDLTQSMVSLMEVLSDSV